VGLPAATAALLNKQMQYRCSHGIGKELHFAIHILINPNNLFSELVMPDDWEGEGATLLYVVRVTAHKTVRPSIPTKKQIAAN
jgi:hypothetical protein